VCTVPCVGRTWLSHAQVVEDKGVWILTRENMGLLRARYIASRAWVDLLSLPGQ
jgi:hypothetical protein